MKVLWTRFALNELEKEFKYYKKEASLKVAQKIKKKAIEGVRIHKDQPFCGQIEEKFVKLAEGHRYLVEGNYKVMEDIVYITDIFHTKQNPRNF
jgi:plasmid stabilization system protein ParE